MALTQTTRRDAAAQEIVKSSKLEFLTFKKVKNPFEWRNATRAKLIPTQKRTWWSYRLFYLVRCFYIPVYQVLFMLFFILLCIDDRVGYNVVNNSHF